MLCSCVPRDDVATEHAAKMFANIIITSRAQRALENTPPIVQSATAIETAAQAGLQVLGYELDAKN